MSASLLDLFTVYDGDALPGGVEEKSCQCAHKCPRSSGVPSQKRGLWWGSQSWTLE